MMPNIRFLPILSLAVLPACAAIVASPAVSSYPAERALFYEAARRIIGLPDGSQLIIFQPDLPNERPPRMAVFITAPGNDRELDRSFSLETILRGEVDKDYPGQIRSVAMSPDHKWLAVVGGWFGARDKRGHNGILLLRSDKQPLSFWRLESWFDVKDLAIGDIAFGPGDLLLVTSRPHRPESDTPPQVTLFTRTGERVGSFIPSTQGATASHTLESRLARITENTFGLFDPHSARVRFLRVADNKVTQEREVPLSFPAERLNVVGFDPRPDGRVVIARTVVVDQHGKTLVTVLDPSGKVADEWQPERSWRYGYADEKHVLHGFESGRGAPMKVTTVSVR